jgi:DNA helicase-2/ATP-dependent DNA helicase PcrA
LLEAGHVDDVIQASYARLLVDEYQDCSTRQHLVVKAMAATLPTCVLGDPLQAIFGFGADGLAKWSEDVCACFPVVATLDKPWRWINAGADELGCWLLEVRAKLLRREPIDLLSAPGAVQWVELDGKDDHRRRLVAARILPPGGKGTVLIIDESVSPASQREFASQTPGAITVEAVDLRDLVSFARRFDITAPEALQGLAEFAATVMTNVGASDLVRRVTTLRRGAARKVPSAVEMAALNFVATPGHDLATDLLVEIGREAGVRTHRPAVLRACLKALQLCVNTPTLSFHEAVIRMREQNRLVGRPLPRRAVGSTLLLKGLESDVAVVLKADALDARNLYVAMTRGSKGLTVCSSTSLLRPR